MEKLTVNLAVNCTDKFNGNHPTFVLCSFTQKQQKEIIMLARLVKHLDILSVEKQWNAKLWHTSNNFAINTDSMDNQKGHDVHCQILKITKDEFYFTGYLVDDNINLESERYSVHDLPKKIREIFL